MHMRETTRGRCNRGRLVPAPPRRRRPRAGRHRRDSRRRRRRAATIAIDSGLEVPGRAARGTLAILRHLAAFRSQKAPVMVGASGRSSCAWVLRRPRRGPVADRLPGSARLRRGSGRNTRGAALVRGARCRGDGPLPAHVARDPRACRVSRSPASDRSPTFSLTWRDAVDILVVAVIARILLRTDPRDAENLVQMMFGFFTVFLVCEMAVLLKLAAGRCFRRSSSTCPLPSSCSSRRATHPARARRIPGRTPFFAWFSGYNAGETISDIVRKPHHVAFRASDRHALIVIERRDG